MKFAVLLRGINVGGQNKVVMADLRDQVSRLGYRGVETYINSGNLFFETDEDYSQIHAKMSQFFAKAYPFVSCFALVSQDDYATDLLSLPDWWQKDLARKDVLFYTDAVDRTSVEERIKAMPLTNEEVHFGQLGVYWGKYQEKEYLKTAYHKLLIKQPFYRQVTIRNGKTFSKIGLFLAD